MARLYAKFHSDRTKTKTIAGNTSIETQINYGTKKDSKLAVRVRVEYPSGSEKPKIYLTLAEEIEAITLKPNV